MQGPFTNAHVGGLAYRHIDLNRYDVNKSVSYRTGVAGTFPTGSIEFDAAVLETKRLEGTSSWVQLRDADGSTTRAIFSDVFDLYDNQWTNMDELIRVIDHRLDIVTNKVSNSLLNVTQSTSGSGYNYTIQTANSFITSSGFAGGTNLSYTTATRNLDGRDNRPEGWALEFKDHPVMGDQDGALGFIGPDYGTPYPYAGFAKAAGYRDEVAKRPVNLRNIKTTTASVQVGNYKHGQEIFQVQPYHQKTWAKRAYESSNIDLVPTSVSSSLPDTTHYQTLIAWTTGSHGNISRVNSNRFLEPAGADDSASNTIEIPRTDLTGSEHNITTRFSAPGGPEVQSIGFLDAYSQTFSVYNAMPFRNLSVLGSGSGESGTIRVVDHLGHRRGLRTLLALHMGQFGADDTYGSISSLSYVTNGSFNKQIRNRSRRYEWNDSSDVTASLSQAGLITGSAYDNMFINTPIPRSELQYSWISAAITGSDSPTQRILGYAPEDGIVSSSAGFVEAIVFPSASSIFAD
jgi:hypothetical protein